MKVRPHKGAIEYKVYPRTQWLTSSPKCGTIGAYNGASLAANTIGHTGVHDPGDIPGVAMTVVVILLGQIAAILYLLVSGDTTIWPRLSSP